MLAPARKAWQRTPCPVVLHPLAPKSAGLCPLLTLQPTAILDFIEEERAAGREVGPPRSPKAFGLDQGGKIWLKRLLRELEAEGETGGGSVRPVHPRNALPPVLLSEIKRRDREGDLIARPLEWNEEQGRSADPDRTAARLAPRKTAAAPAPGVGGHGALEADAAPGRRGLSYSGRVLKVMGKEGGRARHLPRPPRRRRAGWSRSTRRRRAARR